MDYIFLELTKNMAVSLASGTPIFPSTTTRNSTINNAIGPHFNCNLPSQKRRNFINTRLCVATPQSTPTASTSEEKQDSVSRLENNFEVEIEDSEENSSTKFSWRDHWYPVSLVEDIDPRYPTPFQLLNRDLVLWFDSTASQWVAFDDKCPHRLAPLSVIILTIFSIFIFLMIACWRLREPIS